MKHRKTILDKYHRQKQHRHIKTNLLVHMDAAVFPILQSLGYRVAEEIKNTSYAVVSLPKGMPVEEAVDRLSQMDGVIDVELNGIPVPDTELLRPNDPMFSQQAAYWTHLDVVGMWELFHTYPGQLHESVIAISENGFQLDHEDLDGRFILPGYNAADGSDVVTPHSPHATHGTMVAGIPFAANNNGKGVAGLAFNSKCFPIRHIQAGEEGSSAALYNGITEAAERGFRVYSLSYSSMAGTAAEQVTNHAKSKGLVMFCSAGNESNADNLFATLPAVHGVSGIAPATRAIHGLSRYHAGTSFCAQFVGWTTDQYIGIENPDDSHKYLFAAGTSFSSPAAAALAAQMLSIDPSLSVDDVISIMAENCIPEIPPEGSPRYGHGIIQYTQTLREVMYGRTPSKLFFDMREVKQMQTGSMTVAEVSYTLPSGRLKKVWNPTPTTQYALVSTGTQYIDTGYHPNGSTEYELKAYIPNAALMDILGSRVSQTNQYFTITAAGGAGRFGNGGSGYSNWSIPGGVDRWITIKMKQVGPNSVLYVDDIQVSSRSGVSFNATRSLFLYALNSNGTPASLSAFKVLYFRIWDDGVLARDFIPVPAGDTTYSATPAPSNCMWDKVTRQYFVNQGTGAFEIDEI